MNSWIIRYLFGCVMGLQERDYLTQAELENELILEEYML